METAKEKLIALLTDTSDGIELVDFKCSLGCDVKRLLNEKKEEHDGNY